jgi:hypothetical protein
MTIALLRLYKKKNMPQQDSQKNLSQPIKKFA